MALARTRSRLAQNAVMPVVASLVAAAVLVAGVALRVDLAPRVEADFFFAPGGPQLEASRALAERYPAGETLIVRASASDTESPAYVARVEALGRALDSVPGVESVFSVANQNRTSPLWRRALEPAGAGATNVLAQLGEHDARALANGIEAVLETHEGADFGLAASGTPLIVERIRQGLARDLAVFSAVAFAAFGLMAWLVYRDARVVAGTLLACVSASAATLLAAAAAGIGIGLLTANIATIVFVLTLSHAVFLAANWRDAADAGTASAELRRSVAVSPVVGWRDARSGRSLGAGGGDLPAPAGPPRRSPVAEAVARTAPPSAWCMATTALGFSSLLLAPARPLRELGAAGAIGAAVAFACAFTILPAWLRIARANRPERERSRSSAVLPGRPRDADSHRVRGGGSRTSGNDSRRRRPGLLLPPAVLPVRRAGDAGSPRRVPVLGLLALAVLGLGVAAAGTGVARLDTDPLLLSYFDPAGPVRPGLEAIDREGGSSPLLLAVGAADGERLDNMSGYARLWEFQDSLEADPATGIVLSPAPLLAHAREQPLARFLPVSLLLGLLERPETGGIGRGFFREDRREVLYSIRMKEGERTEKRREVVARLSGHAETAGLRVLATGGLYELQDRLGQLIATSLKTGVGGLLALFLLVGLRVAGSARGTASMLACLAAIPCVVLGSFGHLGIAVDIVASPAANVALAMGVDSMIHLAMRARLEGRRRGGAGAWSAAADSLARPVTAACAIVCVGFGIFVLSDFPPTRRFGLAVLLGSATACFATLLALPSLMRRRAAPAEAREPEPG